MGQVSARVSTRKRRLMTSQPDEMRYDTRDWAVAKQLLD
eukprot:COSAG02_NODE_58657_length_276_cov_1.242938_1_plen_38_part_10